MLGTETTTSCRGLVLIAVGVMNLAWMAVITVVIFLEPAEPRLRAP